MSAYYRVIVPVRGTQQFIVKASSAKEAKAKVDNFDPSVVGEWTEVERSGKAISAEIDETWDE